MARKKQSPVEQRDNTTGLEAEKIKQREQSLNALLMGKRVEKQRKKQGFIWVQKGKTQKQIHPSKLELHLSLNWINY